MRRSTAHIIALACWLPVVTTVGAQTTEATRLLDEGNQHFREGDFDQARSSYEGALDLGLESGAAYYNLGNAYFRMDKLGKAMLNYQRATRFFSEDEALAHNMDLVRARARDQLSILPQPVWAKWWNGFVDRVGLTPLFWIGAVCWLGGLGLLGWRIQHGSASSSVRRLSSALIVAGLVASASAVATSVARSDDVTAVVTASQTAVLETPSNEGRIELVVHEALVVDVLGELGRWTHIRLPNGVTGYVETETIEAI